MQQQFEKIVNLCERNGFFRLISKNLGIESTGILLQENLKHEWFNNIVINKNISVFPSSGDLKQTFQFAKDICLETLPFGVTECRQLNPENQNKDGIFHNYTSNGIIQKCFVFVSPNQAQNFFQDWQRERRMWWRKFSASPGRYALSDIRSPSNDIQSVDITAKYKWGKEIVEKIYLVPKPIPTFEETDLKFLENRRTIQAKCVVSETCLSTMILNTICDSYDEQEFNGEKRPILRLHRKLAPYKISFAISSTSKQSIGDELKDLALYLCRQLRNNHVSSLFLPSSYKHTLEAQFKQYDQLGVPYCVQLNEKSLKNGIILLRSRETTLKEQVHIADLPKYVEKLFRNY